MKLKTKIPDGFVKDTPAAIVVHEDVRRLWAIQLDLLAKIDAICRKHGIRYSLDCGSLLGALRHGGFVPWDDDVDVVMPRADFEKFESVVASELEDYQFYQNWQNSPGYYRPFARLLNIRTKAVLEDDLAKGQPLWHYPQSVFVDIFVAENIPDDAAARKRHFKKLKKLHKKYWTARRCVAFARNWRRVRKWSGAKKKIRQGRWLLFLSCFGFDAVDRWFKEFYAELTKYRNDKVKSCAAFVHRPYETIDLSDFDNLVDVNFEFLKVKAFRRADELLQQLYGDWQRQVVFPRDSRVYDLEGVEF